MAGAGYKLFNTGDVLTAAQVNTYLQEQAVMRFASAAARTTALSGVLAEGMVSYLMDTNAVEVYDGSAWVGVGNVGDITGVTAGTGISGGSTSGTVTITNSMATEITAAGDIIVGTGSGTFDNLPIGTTGQVLTADTTVSPYKVKWATTAGGGKLGQLVQTIKTDTFTTTSTSFTDVTGLSVNITPTSTSSKIYVSFTVNGATGTATTNSIGFIRLMRDTTAIAIADTAGNRARTSGTVSTRDTGSNAIQFNSALNFLDSPATTSQITYKIQGTVGGGTLYINRNEDDADATVVPRTVSTITVMEILA
jgi:hypothetical protein